MGNNNKVTAFNNIFEHRIVRLVKQIKDLRKKKGNKEQIKELLKEAKSLKHKMKKAMKKPTLYTITLSKELPGQVIDHTEGLHISSVSETDDSTIIRFMLK